MNLITKLVIVLLCFGVCGAGSFIASSIHDGSRPYKSNTIPIKNRELIQRAWIWT